MARIFPSYEELDSLRPPLEPGELKLIEFLLIYLDDDFQIFVQPFINGDRPDIVIVREHYSVLIIEVKDWFLEHYFVDTRSKNWKVRGNSSVIKSPISQVLRYKEQLYDLHIEDLLEYKIRDYKYWGVVSCALYFHNATESDIKNFCIEPFKENKVYSKFLKKNISFIGKDNLNEAFWDKLTKKVYLKASRPSFLFSEKLYMSFIRYLKPPTHHAEEGKDFAYSDGQKRLIESSPRDQRVKGVVGSGKTTVLAARAVNAHIRTDSRVLVLCFNITLKNYIHDKISLVRQTFNWGNFYVTNYHQFINSVLNNLGIPFEIPKDFDQYNSKQKTAFFEREYYSNKALFMEKKDAIEKYKCVLIDEIQDYKRPWMEIVKECFLEDDGEYVLFGDEKQNIYGLPIENSDLVTNVAQRPSTLTKCFRSDYKIRDLAQRFQRLRFTDKYNVDSLSDQLQLAYEKQGVVKYLYSEETATPQALYEDVRKFSLALNEHPNDVCVLGIQISFLRKFDSFYRYKSHEKTNAMFETEEAVLKLIMDLLWREGFNVRKGPPELIENGLALFLKSEMRNNNDKINALCKLIVINDLAKNHGDEEFKRTFSEFISKYQIDVQKFLDWLEDFKEKTEDLEGKLHRPLENIRNNKKHNFWYNRGTLKISTIHSFKGWEANTLVLVLQERFGEFEETFDEILYTGITRSKENLVILNYQNQDYHEFMNDIFNQVNGAGNSN